MNPKDALFEHARVCCRNCRKMFDIEVLAAFNADVADRVNEQIASLELLRAKCTHCGYAAMMPITFLCFRPSTKEAILVVPDGYQQRYLFAKHLLSVYVKKYKAALPKMDAHLLDNAFRRIIPQFAYLKMINCPHIAGGDQGMIHFSAFPKVTLYDQPFDCSEVDEPMPINKDAVAFVPGNVPSFFTGMWEYVKDKFNESGAYIPTKENDPPRVPVGTRGVPGILFFVGSSIILPILLGVISNVITHCILDRRKSRKELQRIAREAKEEEPPASNPIEGRTSKLVLLQENPYRPDDEAGFSFRCRDTGKEYHIEGTFAQIAQEFAKVRMETLRTLLLPGDCHMSLWVGNQWLDVTAEKEPIGSIDDFEEHFGKLLGPETRARFMTGDANEYIEKAMGLSIQAQGLMGRGKYEEAASMLAEAYAGENTPVEILYNLALCLLELGNTDAAVDLMEQVVIRSVNLPNLSEASYVLLGKKQLVDADMLTDIKKAWAEKRKRDGHSKTSG